MEGYENEENCTVNYCFMNLPLFLKRIGLQSLPDAPLERLLTLHRAMPRTVPFENMAILEGKKISLEPAAIYAKVVEQGRGGYCFELNALLAAALESLGYRVERLIGRVWANGAPAPPLTHMTLRVTVAGRAFLCDVGFGGGTLRDPLPWDIGKTVLQSPDCFRLEETDNGETMLVRLAGDSWKNVYSLLPCTMRAQISRPITTRLPIPIRFLPRRRLPP
jgi:N-hydroxyarylamine O-acetyltransferase